MLGKDRLGKIDASNNGKMRQSSTGAVRANFLQMACEDAGEVPNAGTDGSESEEEDYRVV